jgi:hypothetical protein
MMRQPVGQPTGSAPAYERGGSVVSDRIPHGGYRIAAGAEIVDDEAEEPPSNACGAVKKDGTICTSKKVKNRNHCIGHLRGAKEKE